MTYWQLWFQGPASEVTLPIDPKRTVQAADRDFRNNYRLIAALMLVGAVCIYVLGLMFFDQYIVLILEWYEIALFGWFWALETIRLSKCHEDVELTKM